MQINRYVNGSLLQGVMPPLLLKKEGVGALLAEAQQLPLPAAASSVILKSEEGGFGKEIS